jgi:hypothetical protein
MNKVMTIGALVLGALAAAAALVLSGDRLGLMKPPQADHAAHIDRIGLPWDIAPLPGGASRILGPSGLILSAEPSQASTLADIQRLWRIEYQVGIVAATGETGSLEAYVDPAQLGFVTGKLVVSTALSPSVIEGMKARAAKVEFMESTTRRFTLSRDDLVIALKTPITAISLVPQAQLDTDTVIQRFGPPAQRIKRGEGETEVEHLLYPDKGLDMAITTKGKEVIQYVAPAQFDRLMRPLQTAKP